MLCPLSCTDAAGRPCKVENVPSNGRELAQRGHDDTMNTALLRRALAAHLGQVLTPERAANIEGALAYSCAPAPDTLGNPLLCNEQRPAFYDFINTALQAHYEPFTSRVVARMDRAGGVRAVVLFTDLRRWSCEMAVASDASGHWLSRDLLRAVFRYPFLQLGLRRVTARIEADNAAALRLDEHLGFKREGVQRQQFGDTDCVLMGMLREECRWIKE